MNEASETNETEPSPQETRGSKLHEKINTVGVIVSLAISTTTAWVQFGPKADSISLLEVTGYPTEDGIVHNNIILPEQLKEIETHSSVDTKVRFRIFNTGDRSVAITSIEVSFSKNSSKMFSDIYRSTDNKISLPVNIPSREALEFTIKTEAPILHPTKIELKCAMDSVKTWDFRVCYAKNNRDFYGNEAHHDTSRGLPGIIVWPEHKEQWQPEAIITITTADGTSISKKFGYA